MNQVIHRFLHATLIAVALVVPHFETEAAVLAYDGFASGGSSPTATQYNSSATYPANALAYFEPANGGNPAISGGQNPTTLGFSNAWIAPTTSSGQTAASVFFRANSTSLNYSDGNGVALQTTAGSASITRSGAGSSDKTVMRALDISSIPSTVYISVLLNFTPNQSIEFDFQTLGGNIKPFFGFGVDNTGTPYLQLSNSGNYLTSQEKILASQALASNKTHLLVFKVEQTASPTVDTLSLYVNPLLNSPLGTAAATHSGDFYVANNGDYGWTNLHITTMPNSGTMSFDEFQMSTTWPVNIPEPRIASLSLLAIAAMILRRQRVS